MSNWKTAWGYAKKPLAERMPRLKISGHRQTITVRNNLAGDAVRILLSNAGNKTAIEFDAMEFSVPRHAPVPIMLNGNARIRLEACEEHYCDEIAIDIRAGEAFTITTFIRGSCSLVDTVMNYAPSMNLVRREGRVKYPLIGRKTFKQTYDLEECMWMYGFREIQVRSDKEIKTIATFGDSITQMSFWTGSLAERLYEKYPGMVAVKNCGISGNRLLRDSSQFLFVKGMFGPAGINRFEEDVFGSGHVDIVFVMEGVNDISHPVDLKKPEEMPTADELIRGMKTLADIAHRHKARIYLCTILPFGGSAAWNDKLESVRQQVNKWICRAGYADGFYDFELIISAENKGVRLDEGYHVGDYLHPNADGGKKIAAGINIDTLMADVSCQ